MKKIKLLFLEVKAETPVAAREFVQFPHYARHYAYREPQTLTFFILSISTQWASKWPASTWMPQVSNHTSQNLSQTWRNWWADRPTSTWAKSGCLSRRLYAMFWLYRKFKI